MLRSSCLGRVARLGYLVLAVQSVALPVLAQGMPPGAPSVDNVAEAKKHFELGVKLLDAKEYEAALSEFEKSYALGKRYTALRNKAVCLRQLKRSAEAYYAYEYLLKAHDADLKPDVKKDIQRALDELKMITGEVLFQVDQPDAEISVDGRVLAGPTPLPPIRFNVGLHRVRVAKAGFEPREQEFMVASDQVVKVPVHLEMIATTGHVTIREQNGIPAHVFIDGKDVGPAPWDGDLPAGAHVIELRNEKAASDPKQIDVLVKGKLDFVALVVPINGIVSVRANPSVAKIVIDGHQAGTGNFAGELPPGTHQLEVSFDGFETFRAPLLVERGRTTQQTVTLVEVKHGGGGGAPLPLPDDKDRFTGVRGSLGFMGLFPMQRQTVECPQDGTAPLRCELAQELPYGFGVDLRVGYMWNWVGIEVVGAGIYDQYTVSRNHRANDTPLPGTNIQNVPRNEKFEFVGAGGFGGIGGRLATPGDVVRGTLGIAVGAVYKSVNFRRNMSGDVNDEHKSFQTYTAPGLLFDVGMTLGKSPGSRFFIGFVAWIDFPGEVFTEPATTNPAFVSPRTGSVPDPIPAYGLTTSTQYFIGPKLGLEFGH